MPRVMAKGHAPGALLAEMRSIEACIDRLKDGLAPRTYTAAAKACVLAVEFRNVHQAPRLLVEGPAHGLVRAQWRSLVLCSGIDVPRGVSHSFLGVGRFVVRNSG